MQVASQVQTAEQSGLGFLSHSIIIKFPFLFSSFYCFRLCFIFLEKGGGRRNKIREKCQKTFSTISKNREP